MERLNYTPDEIRDALRYMREQARHLTAANAANWRTKFTLFVEAMTKSQEALRLLARLLEGHRTADALAWYKAATAGKAPPLPTDRYERLALVWKLVSAAMMKVNPDGFDSREKVDLPYVLTNSDLPGGSFGERFDNFRQRFLVEFAEEADRFAAAVEGALPAGAKSVDFWDAALAGLTAQEEEKKKGRK